jgi:uncharacterized protein (TIGR03790 family)
MATRSGYRAVLSGLLMFSASLCSAGSILLPKSGLAPHELAIIINDRDPLSRKIARHYRERRGIPPENLIHVRLPPHQADVSLKTFTSVYKFVHSRTPARVQAYLLSWSRPYRVGCMSITTAFATGYDPSYCPRKLANKPCGITRKSPYFNSASLAPANQLRLRPSMLLAANNFADAERLIERGLAADGSLPRGRAYLLSTSDKSRNVRAATFDRVRKSLGHLLPIEVLTQDAIRDKTDVLFYFTGKSQVKHLDSLGFLPGAVADHLTSSGGQMTPRGAPGQMSSLRWLEAGATGSYGTVFEPCNFPGKFPNPGILMQRYLKGESLIEAYWKSVARPSEGLFIGDPLARPFQVNRIDVAGGVARLPRRYLAAGNYRLESARFPPGPYEPTAQTIHIGQGRADIIVDGLGEAYYRLLKASPPVTLLQPLHQP